MHIYTVRLKSDSDSEEDIPMSWVRINSLRYHHIQHHDTIKAMRQWDGRWVSKLPMVLELEINDEKWSNPWPIVFRTNGIRFPKRVFFISTHRLSMLVDLQGYIPSWEVATPESWPLIQPATNSFIRYVVSRKGLPETQCCRLLNSISLHLPRDTPPWATSHTYHALTQQCDIFVNEYEQVYL